MVMVKQNIYIIYRNQDLFEKMDILIVGGGGSGAQKVAAGAGAGGLVYVHNAIIASGSYNIKVGKGAVGNQLNRIARHVYVSGRPGYNSYFDDIVALGGGAGFARYTSGAIIDGGSGGGGTNEYYGGRNYPGISLQHQENQTSIYNIYQYGHNGIETSGMRGIGGGAGGSGYRVNGNGLTGIEELNIDFKEHFMINDITIGESY